MTATWARRAHRLGRVLGWIVGVGLITVAVIAALAQVMLPALAQHPQWVAAQLGARLHRPVSFESMQGRWTPAGPSFALRGVTLGAASPGQASLRLPEVDATLDFGGWLLPSRHLLNLHVRGVQLDVAHGKDGQWSIRGFGTQDGSSGQPPALGHLSLDLWLDDVHIDVADERTGRHYAVLADQLRAWLGSGEVRVGARLRRAGAKGVLTAAGQFRDDGSNGRVWLAGDHLDISAMLGDASLAGYTAERGHGHLEAWLDWRDGRVVRSVLETDLTGVSLGTPAGSRVDVAAIRGVMDIRQTGDGYRLAWAGYDGSALVAVMHRPSADAIRVGIAASHLQLAPLVPWLALKPGMAAGLAHWLGEGKPRGQISRADVQWQRGIGLTRLEAEFRNVGIDPVGAMPGIDRLSGTLRGDAEAL
ncbi:MAG: TIGR02099 family protein, partial [Xanthomonadaceae bacterium]|nr:TIGR02099 family protein [Xanthomonadaceae bacterium]